jgi:hypothetical protein
MQFNCPQCGHALEAPDGAFAMQGKCKFCDTEIVSPASAGASATLKQTAPPISFAPPTTPRAPNPPPPPPPYQGSAAYQPYQSIPSRGSGMALASVILGVLGLLTCGVTTILGLICGVIAIAQTGPNSDRRGGRTTAIIGTVLSGVLFLMIPIQAAIFIPVVAKARDRAQLDTCMQKVKVLEQAVQVYQVDHNGRLPSAVSWHSSVAPAIPGNSSDPFTCPKENDGKVPYKMNIAASNRTLSTLNSPSRFVVLFEGRPIAPGAGRSFGSHFGGPRDVRANHVGETLATYGFADGSVQSLSPARVPIMAWQR